VNKCTKLDFYSVASPSPFAHSQITWVYLVKIKLGNVVYPLFLRGLLQKGDGEGLVAWREKARLFDTSLTELKSVFRHI
jgi:hypothetical protein